MGFGVYEHHPLGFCIDSAKAARPGLHTTRQQEERLLCCLKHRQLDLFYTKSLSFCIEPGQPPTQREQAERSASVLLQAQAARPVLYKNVEFLYRTGSTRQAKGKQTKMLLCCFKHQLLDLFYTKSSSFCIKPGEPHTEKASR